MKHNSVYLKIVMSNSDYYAKFITHSNSITMISKTIIIYLIFKQLLVHNNVLIINIWNKYLL